MKVPVRTCLLCLALTGCISVGPDYRPPPMAVPAAWNAPAASAAGDISGWWRQFKDPQLDALIDTALAASPDLRSAQSKLREARARSGLSAAASSPTTSSTLSARRSETAGAGSTADSYNAGFDASWEIDLFGGTRRSIEAARATEEAALAGLRDAQVSLAAETARNYLDLRTQQTRLAIARSNLASQQETAQLARWRQQAGLVTELDALQAASTLESTRARIPTLETAVEAALNQLALLTGLDRAAIGQRLDTAAPLPATPTALGLSIPAATLAQRPDVRMAERRLAAATASIGVATAELYPTLKLSGNVGLSSLGLDSLLRGSAAGNSLLASLTTPVFDGGRIRRNIDIQTALQEQALIAYEQSVAQALAEVENALVALAKQRERVASLTLAGDTARLAAQLAQHRYGSGLIDYGSLQDTQRSQLSAEDSLASARGDEAAALVQLYKALGGGFGETTQP